MFNFKASFLFFFLFLFFFFNLKLFFQLFFFQEVEKKKTLWKNEKKEKIQEFDS